MHTCNYSDLPGFSPPPSLAPASDPDKYIVSYCRSHRVPPNKGTQRRTLAFPAKFCVFSFPFAVTSSELPLRIFCRCQVCDSHPASTGFFGPLFHDVCGRHQVRKTSTLHYRTKARSTSPFLFPFYFFSYTPLLISAVSSGIYQVIYYLRLFYPLGLDPDYQVFLTISRRGSL